MRGRQRETEEGRPREKRKIEKIRRDIKRG